MIYIHDYMHNSSIDFEITGPTKLKGSIVTNTSKNGAMGLMCAALLNKSTTILHGIPRIEEVNRMAELLESLDVRVRFIDEHTLEIIPPKVINFKNLDVNAARSMRSAL